MQTARRRRTYAAIALSVVAHVVVLAALGLRQPVLHNPYVSSGPPEPIIPLLLMPRTPPPPPGSGAKPAPVRLHRRPPRVYPGVPPLPPVVIPETPAPSPEPAPPPPVVPRPAPDPMKGQVRAALRGAVGCANPDAVGLSVDERADCARRLAAGGKTAPWLGQGLEPDKQAILDRAAGAKAADLRYRRAAVPSGVAAGWSTADPVN